ncbi:hypothetical protein C8T65DRAFT_644358 [Cerioporus squamosus]|nr:hypothetical protein C8T65DRAFT_644358 [Cerioporus squamosus]
MTSSAALSPTLEALLTARAEARRKALCERNADASNWTWRASGSTFGQWTRSNSWENLKQLTTSGATVTLDVPVEDVSFNPTGGKLYIRQAYVAAHELVWKEAAWNRDSGTVLTGQPGTGAYLLLREKQVVLLHMAGCETVLFYHDEVFVATTGVSSLSLPHYRVDERDFSKVCIWFLFDIPVGHSTPDVVWKGICYPVTAPSLSTTVIE